VEDDSIIFYELFLLAFNIRKEVINVLDYFFSFLNKHENRKVHNMIFLMLNLRLKSLRIIFSFVGKEQGVALATEYDRKSLYPMLVKCHGHLHPLVRLDRICADHNIFEQIASTSEQAKKLVKKELSIFRR
jgi:hypothetical protein